MVRAPHQGGFHKGLIQMKRIAKRLTLAAMAVLCVAGTAKADIKIKTKTTSDGSAGTESTIYIKNKRQRSEMGGADSGFSMATITQCDMKRTIQLNDMTKTYIVSPFDQATASASASPSNVTTKAEPVRRGGIVTYVNTVTDTAERKQMFGYTARHIKTVMKSESSPDACSQSKMHMETDGWYIDLPVEFDCYEKASYAYASRNPRGGCQDEIRSKQIGNAKLGYPVKTVTTMFGEDGKTTTFSSEVVELSKAMLEDALFDIPVGYREVQNAQEMYSTSAMMATAGGDDNPGGSTGSISSAMGGNRTQPTNSGMKLPTNSSNVATSSGSAGTDIGAKKEGVIRVGVAFPKATAGEGVDAGQLAEAVRSTMVNYLTGPSLEVVSLQARLPQQIELEAKQKQVDFIVYTTVAHKKGGGGGGFGGFLRAAAPVASVAGYGGGYAGSVASTVASTTIYTAAQVASSVKAKDEVTMEYRLMPTNGSTPVIAKTLKAKAKTDGEDILTQLIEQAASAVLAEATRK